MNGEQVADEMEEWVKFGSSAALADFVRRNLPTILAHLRAQSPEAVERAAGCYHGQWPVAQFDGRWHADERSRWSAALRAAVTP